VNKGYIHVRHLLSPQDSSRLLQLLHFTIRKDTSGIKSEALRNAADSFAAHLQDKTLAPHHHASLHLLSIYKETRQFDKGKQYWSWLIGQDGEYVDEAVYGAAIELLSHAGESLEELEELYRQALKRFPDNFIEYHLSPEAIVPDRGQQMLLQIPMTLLQGILTARVLAGDWRNAYLALDTALRLIPDLTPSRFFDVLINERPVPEAVRVFQLACRAKVQLSPTTLTSLISRMRDVVKGIPEDNPNAFPETLRMAMTVHDLVRAQAGAGGRLTGQNFSSIITKCLLPLVSWYPEGRPIPKDQEDFNLAVTRFAREMLELFLPPDGPGVLSAYNSLITLAGNAKDTESVIYAIKRVTETRNGPDDITCRALLIASAMCGNPEGLWQNAWHTMVAHMEDKKQKLAEKEWTVLGRSLSYLPGLEAMVFVEEEMKIFSLPGHIKETVRGIAKDTPSVVNPLTYMAAKSIEFGPLTKRLKEIQQLTKEQMIEFNEEALLEPFFASPTLGSIENLRTIYDELTTDPSQPPPLGLNAADLGSVPLDSDAEAGISNADALADKVPVEDVSTSQNPVEQILRLNSATDSSGLPYAFHRLLNWMVVNELLVMAERHEQRHGIYSDDVVKASIISTDRDGPRKDDIKEFDTETRPLQWLEPEGKLLLTEDDLRDENGLELEELRALVLRVRGRA
jgi:tetratricopeptide (TPR) repeat protein